MAELVRWLRSLAPSAEWESRGWRPAVDVYRLAGGWLIKCDVAGVRPEDMVVTLRGRELTIQGVRRDCRLEQGCRHYLMEIEYCRFERTIVLPEEPASARVTLSQELGMALIRIET
jgi:HSP20 family protein